MCRGREAAIAILGMLEVAFIVAFLWLMVAKPGA